MFDCLDVGCGSKPSGTVNCDLYVNDGFHREGKTVLEPKSISNFVLCDVQHLPFKDGAFHVVFSSHVIEHVPKPFLMLKEMWRVCKSQVKIVCPHGFGDRLARRDKRVHINHLTGEWFDCAGRKVGCSKISVAYSAYYYIPHKFLPWFMFPLELTVYYFREESFCLG
ncbi:MAG: methyltransferase domain-containing protein [Candidatus Bathyarchaeia archaeon]|jgi:ubiquinone/menaquinone biosynthesis C-methylase UbiE